MGAKHTPGPWRVNGPERASLIQIINDDYVICEVIADLLPEELPAEANARLIASAPDFFAACVPSDLEDAADIVEAENSFLASELRKQAAAQRAAIARATLKGKSQ